MRDKGGGDKRANCTTYSVCAMEPTQSCSAICQVCNKHLVASQIQCDTKAEEEESEDYYREWPRREHEHGVACHHSSFGQHQEFCAAEVCLENLR